MPNNFDAINQLVGVLKSIKEEAAQKQAAEDEAERLASESARRDELVAIERQNAETERARVEALAQQQAYAQHEREAARQAEQELRTQVSTAVLEGRCEDAKTIALLASRIDMAEQAMRLCKPKVPAKKSKNSKTRADSGPIIKPSIAPSKSSASDSVVAAVPTAIAARQSVGLDAGVSLGGKANVPPSLNADYQYSQGLLYYRGEGVEQDYPTALVWYRKAAEQGHAPAQQSIGDMYYQAKGVAWDYSNALVWYRKAADQGQLEALNSIGYMYHYGVGVTQDNQIAVSWYYKGVALGGKLPRELWVKPTAK